MSEEITTSYSGVTLSEEEFNSLDDGKVGFSEGQEQKTEGMEQTQASEVSGDQSLPETEQQETEEVEVLELDGQEYDMETISQALEAFNNKSEWQKSNTEKAQTISADRKALEAEQKLWMGLKENEDAMAALKDVLEDDHPLFSTDPVVAEEEPTQDTKEVSKLQELEERLNEITQAREQEKLDIEAEIQVNQDIAKLKEKHPVLGDQEMLDQVITTAIDKGFTGYEGLEDAFALTLHSAAEDSAFKTAVNRMRNAKAMKSVPDPGPAKGIHEDGNVVPRDYKSAKADALKEYNFE